jgi:hypothetical protein
MGFWASGRKAPAAKSLYRSVFPDDSKIQYTSLPILFLLLVFSPWRLLRFGLRMQQGIWCKLGQNRESAEIDCNYGKYSKFKLLHFL